MLKSATIDTALNAPSYCLSQTDRDRLRLDPDIGAGNFLQYAVKLNRMPTQKTIFIDKTLNVFSGLSYSSLSLSDLSELSIWYASSYLKMGIKPKDPVGIYISDGIEYLIHFIALTSIGAIPALINGSLNPEIVAPFIAKLSCENIIVDQNKFETLHNHVIALNANIKIINMVDMILDPENLQLPAWYPYLHQENDPVMITHSSGTTGIPKAVTLNHSGFFYGIRHLLGLSLMPGIEKLLSSLPSSHNSSIAYSMYALLCGVELMILSDRSGKAVAEVINSFAPTTVVSFPQTYVELAELSLHNDDFSSVNYWINSGDAAHEAHIKSLVKYGHHYRGNEKIQGSQFVDGLGSSEMGHTLIRVIHTPYTHNYDRCVGFAQKWVDAVVLDEFGREVSTNTPGFLGVKAPSVTSGYWNDSVLTNRSKLGGYWLTGDIVYSDERQCFFHLDRIPDVIKMQRGTIYSVQAEELCLKNLIGISECVIIGVSSIDDVNALGLFVPKNNITFTKEDLLDQCNKILLNKGIPHLNDIHIVTKDEIPVGVTGKVLKRTLRERYSNV